MTFKNTQMAQKPLEKVNEKRKGFDFILKRRIL